ncbi:LAMI_0E05622g1_1 [Lachancea mirantina]|uniref:LAMI_0E05622g1_1 n=1 Tax=Lachancea mirantina TaxID=1230905 RepID=A0A1G4JLJ1_9SACH|nr:LAMI_0E05622g1_1 [Lachancea mirantina]
MTSAEDDANISSQIYKTFKQLQEGEKTADALESMLDRLDDRLRELISDVNSMKQDKNDSNEGSKNLNQ